MITQERENSHVERDSLDVKQAIGFKVDDELNSVTSLNATF